MYICNMPEWNPVHITTPFASDVTLFLKGSIHSQAFTLKDNYIAHAPLLEVPAGDTHIEDVNLFLGVFAVAKRFDNEVMVYLQ